MPCLKKMHGSLRSGVNGAKGGLGPSCGIAVSVSFKSVNWSEEGSPLENTFKKNPSNFQTVIYHRQISWLCKPKLKIYNGKTTLLFKKKEI